MAGGTLKDGGGGALTGLTFFAASTTVNSGATLDFNNSFNQAIRNLNGGGNVKMGNAAGDNLTLFVDGGTSQTFSGTISGKHGSVLIEIDDRSPGSVGTMIFTGANTYAGGTTICSCAALQLGDISHTGSIVDDVTVYGKFNIVNADTSGITSITNDREFPGATPGKTTFSNATSAGTIAITNLHAGKTVFNDTSTAANATIVNRLNGTTVFNNSATAGSAGITNRTNGETDFNNNSTAGTANIVNMSTGLTTFNNMATAGSASITNNGGETDFNNQSSAGTADIVNRTGGLTSFANTSTAGSADITNRFGGETAFSNNSTAGGATIVNRFGSLTLFSNNSDAGIAGITNQFGGALVFSNKSSAASATIVNNSFGGPAVPFAGVLFTNQSSAGNAIIVNNNNGLVAFGVPFSNDKATAANANITNNAGSELQFNGLTTAGSATITTNSGAQVIFFDASTGGNARFITNGTGLVDFGQSIGPNFDGRITAGSIEGSGFYYIGGFNTLVVGGNNLSTEVSGVIADNNPCGCTSGSGSLEKVGSGQLTLSGINTYTGTTVVNGGFLNVMGSIASSSGTTVNNGGALTGSGIVSDTTIASGGIFLPGSGVGTFMSVQGNLAFQSGALYLVQLNSTNSTFADVTGTAQLHGDVGATFAPGSTVMKQYMILHAASGVSGTFDGLSVTVPNNLVASLAYDPTHAYINFNLNFGAANNLNVNQTNVANALSNFFNSNGGIPTVFATLSPAGLTQASGELATGTQQATFNAMNLFLSLLTDPFVAGRGSNVTAGGGAQPYAEEDGSLAYAAKKSGGARDALAKMPTKAEAARNDLLDSRWSVWGSAFGGGADIRGNAALGSNDANVRAFGFAAGADYRISPATVAGFALAGGGTNFSVTGSGYGRSDMFQAGAFVRHTIGAAYVTGALAYGGQEVTTDRFVTIAGLDHLRAQFNSNTWSGRLEGGYRYATPWMGITPYAAAQFTTIDLPAYAEQVVAGSGMFALNYNAKNVTDPRTELGVRTDRSFAMSNGILTLRGRLAWAHDYDTDRNITPVFQSLPGAFFVVNGAAQAHELRADHGIGGDAVAERLVGRRHLRGRVLQCDELVCRQGRAALRLVVARQARSRLRSRRLPLPIGEVFLASAAVEADGAFGSARLGQLEISGGTPLDQHRALLHGNPLRLGKVVETAFAIAGLQPQQTAQPVVLARGPALAGLDFAGDARERREPFLRTMRSHATACKHHAPCRQGRQALGDHPFHAVLGEAESLFDGAMTDLGHASEQIGVRPPIGQIMVQRQVAQARGMEGEAVGVVHEGGEQASGKGRGVADRLVMSAGLGVFERGLAPGAGALGIAEHRPGFGKPDLDGDGMDGGADPVERLVVQFGIEQLLEALELRDRGGKFSPEQQRRAHAAMRHQFVERAALRRHLGDLARHLEPHIGFVEAGDPVQEQRRHDAVAGADARRQLDRVRDLPFDFARAIAARGDQRSEDAEPQVEFALVALESRWQPGGLLQRRGEMRDRFHRRRTARRIAPGALQIDDGGGVVAGFRELVRQHVRHAVRDRGKVRLDGVGDQLVDAQPVAPQQQKIGGVAEQRVAEIDGVAEAAVARHEDAARDQALDGRARHRLAERRHRDQQVERDVTADRGRKLRGLAAVLQQVEPRQQDFVERDRNGGGVGRAGRGVLHRLQAARQFLGENRNAVRTHHDRIHHAGRHLVLGSNGIDQPPDLLGLQAHQLHDVRSRLLGPLRHVVGPRSRNQQHRKAADHSCQPLQPFVGRRIRPVHVLDDHDGTLARDCLDDVEQRFDGARANFRGRKPQQEPAVAALAAQQLGDQRQPFGRRLAEAAQQRVELVELAHISIGRLDAGHVVQIMGDRVERPVGVDRRALQHDALSRLDLEPAVHLLDQARLADAGLAGDDDDLALAKQGGRGAVDQARDLVLAADHRQAARAVHGLEAGRTALFAEHAIGGDRSVEPFEVSRSQILQTELAADDPCGCFRDQHLAGRGFALQPRRKVGRFADQRMLLDCGIADEIAGDDEPGGNSDPHFELVALRRHQLADRLREHQPGRDRARRVVLAGAWIAEGREHAVADVAQHVAAVTFDQGRTDVLVAGEQLQHDLGIEVRGELGVADEVAEQRRDLAPLGDRHRPRCHGRRARDRRLLFRVGPLHLLGGDEPCNRIEQAASMADRADAELDQIGRGQMRQVAGVDVVVEECLQIAGQPELLQPRADEFRVRSFGVRHFVFYGLPSS